MNLVNNIKMYANDLKQKFNIIIQMAIDTELFISNAIKKLTDALNFCNRHGGEINQNCGHTINALHQNCNILSQALGVCEIVKRLKGVCKSSPNLPQVLCELPRHVVDFFQRTVGRKLAEYVQLIENEFYVDVDVKRSYAYNITKSKSYSDMTKEIKFDVEQKFWYVSIVRRVFNFVSLILVIWILLTATIYHMHYLRELPFDNMYLDERLDEAAFPKTINLAPEHAKHYLKPFSVHMNHFEISKLYISGFVWLVIVGYIGFFVTLDFVLFELVDFLVETLRDILFTSDLPLIDLETKTKRTKTGVGGGLTEDKIVKYNRTYLSSLRRRHRLHHLKTATTANITQLNTNPTSSRAEPADAIFTTNGTMLANQTISSNVNTTSSIQAFYDRLMASLESDIPDDVEILDSLEGCLPKAQTPFYNTYRALLYLAMFTLGAVFVEAFALRTRHCIENLYSPRTARRRAKWLYRKIMSEKPKYDDDDNMSVIKS
jgi:hypothetical protein